MPNPNILPPHINTAAAAAWERAQLKQKVSEDFGATALFGALDAAVNEAQKQGTAGFDGLERIENLEVQRSFEQAFLLSERLVRYAGFSAPTPDQMLSAGVNFRYLAEQFERMEQEDGVTPYIVLAPHGLGKQTWLDIAKAMTADKTIADNPLGVDEEYTGEGYSGLYGLYIDGSIDDNTWGQLDQTPTVGSTTPPTYTTKENGKNIDWTLRLISGKEAPTHLNMSYEQSQQQNPPIQHQTIAESLTYNLNMVLNNNEVPFKTPSKKWYSWCWRPENHKLGSAPVTTWETAGYNDTYTGSILHVYTLSHSYSDNITGTRSPVG